MSRLASLFSLLWVLLAAAPAVAQTDADAEQAPAHISVVDGSAALERDGRGETAPASMPLLAGDRVRTQDGRVEVLFADGSTLHLDSETTVDFQSDEVIRLIQGRVRLNIAGTTRSVGYRVDAPSAWVQIATPGEYRISILSGSEVELAVLRGSAELVNEDGRTALGAGERAFARAGASPSSAYVYNSAAWDAFDRWSEERRGTRLGVSAQYLPDTVQPYAATFNTYGYWQHVPTYGHVWYPRVRPGWRPYYHGRWVTLRPWGWTWIGADPWAWPTHHFGRWGFSAGAWFWIPGRHWGPAWVSWAYAPSYVSWCPLGWNNRPVFGWGLAVYGGRRWSHWDGWTVVPHHRFGHGFVHANVINASHISVRTRNAFVVRNTAPEVRGYAVPRSSAPIRTAVSRSGAFGSTAAFNRRPDAAAGAATDAAAAFRNRGAAGARVGPGYPEAARPPVRAVPSRERGAPAAGDPTAAFRSRSRSRDAGAASTSGVSPAPNPRAVPRSTSPEAPSPGATPQYRTAPPPEYRAVPSPSQSAPSDRSRAVPRGGRDNPAYAPPPSGGVQPDRSPYRAPRGDAPADGPRAIPRGAPDGGGSPAYRPRGGGVERSAPSGMSRPSPAPSGPPPQSASPSRGGGDRSSDGGGARSRGGNQSSGRATSRSRGGR